MSKKFLLPLLFLVAISACKKEDPAPTGPAPVADPRDAYTGNYHFSIARQTHVYFPSHQYNDTTLFDGTVTKMMSNDSSLVIAFGNQPYDTIRIAPDETGYFYNYTPYGVYTGAFNQSGSVVFSQYSIYTTDSTCYDVVSGMKY